MLLNLCESDFYKRKMSIQALDQLDTATKNQMATVFSVLLLHDAEQEVTEASIQKVLSTAGITVEPYWPGLFLGAIGDQDIASFLTVSGGGAGAGPAQTGGAVAAEEEKKEEPEEEEADVSMGGLFSD